jgi:hypothetical protein
MLSVVGRAVGCSWSHSSLRLSWGQERCAGCLPALKNLLVLCISYKCKSIMNKQLFIYSTGVGALSWRLVVCWTEQHFSKTQIAYHRMEICNQENILESLKWLLLWRNYIVRFSSSGINQVMCLSSVDFLPGKILSHSWSLEGRWRKTQDKYYRIYSFNETLDHWHQKVSTYLYNRLNKTDN